MHMLSYAYIKAACVQFHYFYRVSIVETRTLALNLVLDFLEIQTKSRTSSYDQSYPMLVDYPTDNTHKRVLSEFQNDHQPPSHTATTTPFAPAIPRHLLDLF